MRGNEPTAREPPAREPPKLTAIPAVHRLNLFPLTHLNFFHMIFNLVAVAPLLERFEAEFGTLVTLALFTGRK
jgi:membrane associated rhomboid family serine protease